MKNGWQVAIDLCYKNEENQNILNSPLFETEEQADNWYRTLDFSTQETFNLDIIMVHYVNSKIENTYII